MSDEAFDMDLPDGVASNGHTATAAPGDDTLKQFMDDALASVLRTAQDQAAQMMQRARDASEAEAALGRQLREQAQRESDRMIAWRSEVEPLVQAVNARAATIRASIADVPGRVAEALAPVNDALADVDQVLGRLTDVLREPSNGPGSGPMGPSGPGGPGGGSRAFGTLGETMGASEGQDSTQMATVHELQESPTAESSEPAPEATSEQASTEATAEVEAGAPEASADMWSEEAAASATLGPWVDWPGDANAREGEPVAAAEAEPEMASDSEAAPAAPAPQMAAVPDPEPEAEAASHDEDDVALRSATSQLRRAVTDIDWHDLPSASNG